MPVCIFPHYFVLMTASFIDQNIEITEQKVVLNQDNI